MEMNSNGLLLNAQVYDTTLNWNYTIKQTKP